MQFRLFLRRLYEQGVPFRDTTMFHTTATNRPLLVVLPTMAVWRCRAWTAYTALPDHSLKYLRRDVRGPYGGAVYRVAPLWPYLLSVTCATYLPASRGQKLCFALRSHQRRPG